MPPKLIPMFGQCRSTMGLLFSTLKQEVRKMFKKKHNLFLQGSSLGILGCNLYSTLNRGGGQNGKSKETPPN